MKNVLIVEDKQNAAKYLGELIKQVDDNTCLFYAGTKADAYEIAMERNISLMMVDIVLNTDEPGDVSGIEFVANIRKIERYRFIPVIMTTSLEDPKMYAYSDLHCYGFIEKPYDPKMVMEIVEGALKFPVIEEKKEKFYFKRDGIIYAINPEEIIYIENEKKKVTFYTVNDDVIVPYQPLAKLLKQLNSKQFMQCNRSCIVNKNYIDMVDTINRFIKLKKSTKVLEIGVTMKKKIFAELNDDF